MRRPLYHLLDPLWSRVRLPYRSRFTVERAGAVTMLRMSRSYFGRELQPVHCFAVFDTLIDTGVESQGEAVLAFAREAGIRRALLTHHHEDHAGNAGPLGREGVDVRAGDATRALIARDLPIRFYQHFLWGKARPARAAPIGDAPPIGPHRAVVIPAPGHCEDQLAFHVPAQGWLFTGDVFLHERVKVFRRDEDFAAGVATLKRLIALDFESLFCAHRPRLTGGKAALVKKLDWLLHLEGEARALHARGLPAWLIARRLIPPPGALNWITLGDASRENVIRSILFGPEPRPEVVAAQLG